MAEFTYNPIQLVEAGQPVLLNNSIPCNKGYVLHNNEEGLVTLRGVVNNPCANFARYQVTFNANIAIPEGGTVGEISVAIAKSGEAIQTSRARVTPTATDAYFNVSCTKIVTVAKCCCPDISVENVSDQAINVQNANLTVTRVA